MIDREETAVDLERVKRERLAVKFATLLERAEFLTACEEAGIRWRSGERATEIIHAEPEVVYRISEEGIVFGGMAGVTKNTVPYSSILRHPCRLCQCGTCAAVEDCMRMGPPTDLVPGPCALCRRLGNSVVTDCPGYTTEEDLDRENAAQKGNGKKAPRNCLLRHLASWKRKKGRKQHEPHKTNRHRLGALTISRRHE